jgi:tRNA splicing endonuclease
MKEVSSNTESLSLRDSMKGSEREESFTEDPKRYVKVLQTGFCLHSGPAFGEHGGAPLS